MTTIQSLIEKHRASLPPAFLSDLAELEAPPARAVDLPLAGLSPAEIRARLQAHKTAGSTSSTVYPGRAGKPGGRP